MDKRSRTILIIVSILGWGAIGGLAWYFYNGNQKTSKIVGQAEYDTLIQPAHYKRFPSQPFKHIILESELGPVKVFIEQKPQHSIMFHETYQKYVNISYKGDTLILHTIKTPKSTKESPIFKQIYIDAPELNYYSGEASQTTFSRLNKSPLKVDSRSSYIRFYSCKIDQLALTTDNSCTYLLEDNCSFINIKANINENSRFTCYSYIDNDLILKAKNFKNVELNEENFKKIIMDK